SDSPTCPSTAPSPPLEVPSSPFAFEGEEGTEHLRYKAEPGPSRSGSNGHDAGDSTTCPNQQTSPARGVTVAPAEQGPAQRPDFKPLPITHPPSNLTASRQRSRYARLPIPKGCRHSRERRNFDTPKFEAVAR